ncbi:iron complex transport system permease protein [Streptosporangium brasiliense]|uniref:Iron complex transport system permease protein n=2 Tax=Streptosporangiaceae TaxID=2004 RepID=A0ABT9QX66_9ACTN|nr:iron complex transport system permease protein [Streptosporangium brasiliense]
MTGLSRSGGPGRADGPPAGASASGGSGGFGGSGGSGPADGPPAGADAAPVGTPLPDAGALPDTGAAGRGARAGRPVRRAAGVRPAAALAASALLLASMLAALLIGAADIAPERVALQLLDWLPIVSADSGLAPVEQGLLWELRLPRVLLAAIVGGLLAVAGAAYQGVFRNPLADPYLLGAAAGAGLTTTAAIVFMKGDDQALVIPAAAFAGAVGGVLLAYALGNVAGRGGGTATLVLAGVAVTSFLTAVQTFLQQLRVEELQRIYAWILGDVGGGWSQIGLAAPYAAASVVVMLLHGRLLDVLSVGDDEAGSLGLNVARVRLVVLLAASLATASAVAVSGLIGFVGIVVPHVVRRLAGGSYRSVLPLSLIGGAAFLVLADLIARTVLAPAELPIGVVTAFVGAPFFVAVLRMTRRVET